MPPGTCAGTAERSARAAAPLCLGRTAGERWPARQSVGALPRPVSAASYRPVSALNGRSSIGLTMSGGEVASVDIGDVDPVVKELESMGALSAKVRIILRFCSVISYLTNYLFVIFCILFHLFLCSSAKINIEM